MQCKRVPLPCPPQSHCLLQTPLSSSPRPGWLLSPLEVLSKSISDVPLWSFHLVPVTHHHGCVYSEQPPRPSGHPILGQLFHQLPGWYVLVIGTIYVCQIRSWMQVYSTSLPDFLLDKQLHLLSSGSQT